MLRDGTSFRAQYRGHGETELLVVPLRPSFKALLTLGRLGQERVQPLSDVEFVAKSRLTGPTKILYASVFVFGVVIFASYVFHQPDDR